MADMAFKRSAVRSRLSAPKDTCGIPMKNLEILGFLDFSFYLSFEIF